MAIVRFQPTGWTPEVDTTESISGTSLGVSEDSGAASVLAALSGASAGTSLDGATLSLNPFTDDFEANGGDGALTGWTAFNAATLPDVARRDGYYDSGVISEDGALWYEGFRGRADWKLQSFPDAGERTYVFHDVGIGPAANPRLDLEPDGTDHYAFCGIIVHDSDTTDPNYEFMVIGHWGASHATIESKTTVDGSSSVSTAGANAVGSGVTHCDMRLTLRSDQTVRWAYRAVGGETWTELFDDGIATGGPYSFGAECYIGMIAYTDSGPPEPMRGTVGAAELLPSNNEPSGLTLWHHMDGTNNPASPALSGFDDGVLDSGWYSSSGESGPQGQFKIVNDGSVDSADFIVSGVATAVPTNPTGAGSSLRIGHRGFGGGNHTAGFLLCEVGNLGWPAETSVPSGSTFDRFYARWTEYAPTDLPHPVGKRFFFMTPNGGADMFPDWSYTDGEPGREAFIRLVAQGQTGAPLASPKVGCYDRGMWHTTEVYMEEGSGVNGTWLLRIWVDDVLLVDSVAGIGQHKLPNGTTIEDTPFEWLPADTAIDGVQYYPNVDSGGIEHDNRLLGEVYISVRAVA